MNEPQADRAVIARARSAPMAPAGEAGSDPSASRGFDAKLARGSIAASVVFVGGAGLTYCAQLAVARAIGPHGYGIYVYVLAWVTVLAYLSALGFDISLLRFVPAYLATRAFGFLRGVIQYASRRVAAVGCGIALTGVAAILAQAGKLPPDFAKTFAVGFALVPILALLWIRAAVVRGFGGVVAALAPDRVVRDGVLLGVIFFASVGAGWRIDAGWAMVVTVLGSAAGLGLVSFAIRQLRPEELESIGLVYDRKNWRRPALPLVAINVAEALMNRIGVMLLGWMVDTKAAGIYAVAFNIAFTVTLPRTAVNALLAPAISDLFVRNNQAVLRAVVAKAASWMLLGAACIALPLSVLAEPILALFGRDFVAGAPALRILLIGQVIAAAAGSQLQLMNMTGHERSAATLLLCSAAVNAAIGTALIRSLGPAGAALAATTALIGWNAAMGLSIRRHLRLFPGVLAAYQRKSHASPGPKAGPRHETFEGGPDTPAA